jgi:hypothetical protein
MSYDLDEAIQDILFFPGSPDHVIQCLHDVYIDDGTTTFERFATQRVLAVLKPLLIVGGDDDKILDSTPDYVDPATGECWEYTRLPLCYALRLIRAIDPPKGAIDAKYSGPFLGLCVHTAAWGNDIEVDMILILCQYASIDISARAHLLKSFLTGAERWLKDKHWTYLERSLKSILGMLDANYHSELIDDVRELSVLICQARLATDQEMESLQVKIRELKGLIDEQDSLEFVHFQNEVRDKPQDNKKRERKRRRKRYRRRNKKVA